MLTRPSLSLLLVCSLGVVVHADEPQTGQTQQQDRQQLRQDHREQRQELRQNQREERQANRPVGQAPNSQHLDKAVASCLKLMNKEEIVLSQFAAERAQNPQVKEFAQKLEQDHQQFLDKLQAHFGKEGKEKNQADNSRLQGANDRGADRNQPRDPLADASRDTGRIEQRVNYAPQAGDHHDSDLHQWEKAAAEECLRLTKEELSKHQGDQFDQAFLGQQIAAHISMIAKLKTAQDHVSGDLKQLLQEGHQSAEQHKQHAEKLMKEIDSNSANNRGANQRTE